MLTDESVLEWASGWIGNNTLNDPTYRQRFLDGLLEELKARRAEERVRVIAWLNSEDARRYTEVGPLVAKALEEGRHLSGPSPK